jgi:hypothetical protein
VFSTNRAYALDLYLVFANRTHFEQSMGEFVNSPNSISEGSKPVNMHTKQDATSFYY